jgi:predicted PurR-regulated permease PerM
MLITGGLTTVALLLLGLPLALVLGVLTFVLAFIPYIGPILAFVPIVLVAFMEGPQTLLWVGLIYVAVMAIESYVVTPLVQQKVIALPPALLLFSQLLMGALAGVLGLALAPPLAVCVIIAVQVLYVRGKLHDDVPLLGTEDD